MLTKDKLLRAKGPVHPQAEEEAEVETKRKSVRAEAEVRIGAGRRRPFLRASASSGRVLRRSGSS